MKILVAGGAGYIGSHTCVELLQIHPDADQGHAASRLRSL